MREYFIYVNDEQTGPFNFEELKTKNLSRATLVWFDELPEWQKAETIDELKPLFTATPPPILAKAPSPPVPPTPEVEKIPDYISEENQQRKIFGIKRNFFLYGVAALALIISISAFSGYKNDAKEAVQHEQYNQQLQEQQAAIDAQNARIAEQERLEKERIEREKKIARENRIKEISEQLTIDYNNLDKAKKQLHDVSAFQLLRSRSERHEQISAAEAAVVSWQNEINQLESELNSLNNLQ